MEKQKQIYFIVNGTETTIFTDGTESVADLAKTAIIQADNIQRPIDNYQVIHNERTLNWNKPVFEQGVKEEDVIFLSLKAGSGASAYSRERVEALEKALNLTKKSAEKDVVKVLLKQIEKLEQALIKQKQAVSKYFDQWEMDQEKIKSLEAKFINFELAKKKSLELVEYSEKLAEINESLESKLSAMEEALKAADEVINFGKNLSNYSTYGTQIEKFNEALEKYNSLKQKL